AGLLAVSAAAAADLPTKKAPPVAEKPNCYATFYSWLDSTAADCPLSAYGVTVYGTLDMGGGYETAASKFNKDFNNGVNELISKASNSGRWQAVPNGLSQSNVGVKIKEQIVPNWFIVGDVNFGFDPYSFQFANGPASLVDNNGLSSIFQSANADSSRAGSIDNTRAYVGLSNSTFGTLTFGRQYAFSNDMANNYDPFGGAYAFSLIGSSGTPVGGLGDTELARYNTSIKYQVQYQAIRAGALVQVGNYSERNSAENAYQFDLGADYAGFSLDAIYSHATDAVFLSSLSSYVVNHNSAIPGIADDLSATIANVDSGAVAAKYKNGPFQAFAGYAYDRFTDPTDSYATNAQLDGFTAIGDIYVPGGKVNTSSSGTGYNISTTAYLTPKVLQTAWIGGKYAILSNLDFAVGYYHEWQNNYTNSTTKYNTGASSSWPPSGAYGSNSATGGHCGPNLNYPYGTATPQGANSGNCPGHEDVISGMLDWRPVKRVDVYGGVMYSKVEGGMANGFAHTDNTAYTGGVRINF
ncbi:MAG: porin, partial [Xanthobacteraceae bacterium]|nr:porin [Xanthobacteraceae bacterium]